MVLWILNDFLTCYQCCTRLVALMHHNWKLTLFWQPLSARVRPWARVDISSTQHICIIPEAGLNSPQFFDNSLSPITFLDPCEEILKWGLSQRYTEWQFNLFVIFSNTFSESWKVIWRNKTLLKDAAALIRFKITWKGLVYKYKKKTILDQSSAHKIDMDPPPHHPYAYT